jgi:PHD/YefM family antitoxin component YafN of YafNO toxin-antitoxin module
MLSWHGLTILAKIGEFTGCNAKESAMQVTATVAKNRFGQMLDACQSEPVFIEKSGRDHSVLISMQQYAAMQAKIAADDDSDIRLAIDPAKAFYAKYKGWVDWQNELTDKHGIWSDGLVEWQGDLSDVPSGDAASGKVA